jgi:A/G-specific adenine glycosylase
VTSSGATSAVDEAPIAPALLAWFDQHGRHDLPWQHPRTPYRVWLAEIMLQQTQVATVIPYSRRFLAAFPDLASLAAASQDDVLALWAGLGYYSRGRNLHRAAQLCVSRHGGALPADFEALLALPGIGRSTAGAILAQAFGQPVAILDGNVKRVLSRRYAVEGWPGEAAIERRLWALAQAQTPPRRSADYTQAIMDLGASVCRRNKPDCLRCPLQGQCQALALGLVERLPAGKPRPVRPERRLSMLWLVDSVGRVLLERRPAPGLWGGLWSLPEIDWLDREDLAGAETTLRGWCEARALLSERFEALPPFRHDFTHFRLQVQPWRLSLHRRAATQVAEEGRSGWFDANELALLGLPRPVQRLLEPRSHTLRVRDSRQGDWSVV